MTTHKLLLKYLSFGLTGVLVLILITATILEKMYGSNFVAQYIYASPLVIALWGITAASALLYLLKCKQQKQLATFGLHLSFILILAGALTTHLTGTQGALHLRMEDAPTATFTLPDGSTKDFPFRVSLKEFQLAYYPGTFAPMDFISTILIDDEERQHEGEISMNHIYSYQNFRFYQSKYDQDSKGTTLSIAYDPYGITVTYAGYILLLLTMLAFFLQKESRFRTLLRHPLLRKGAAVCLLVAASFLSAPLQAAERPQALPKKVAAQFGDLYIYYNDRICPLQTLAKDFTVKLYGEASYKGLIPEQVLTGWIFYYDDWKQEPVIRIKSNEIKDLLGTENEYVALTDFVDINGYKLEAALQGNTPITDRQSIENANEKFNLISMVSTGSILRIYPYQEAEGKQSVWYSLADKLPKEMPNDQWIFIRNSMNYVAEKLAGQQYDEAVTLLKKIKKYQRKEAGESIPADARFTAEKVYNRFGYSKLLAIACICIGLLSFVYYCRCMVSGRKVRAAIRVALNVLLLITFIYLSAAISLRGYVSNHLPLANGYETMQFMAWCALLLTALLQRRFIMALPFGYLLCGLTLMVSMLGEANPQITQLMPVLQSPLLSIHVVVIMIAYSLLAFVMLNGVTAIILHHSKNNCNQQIERLQVVSQLILYPAVFLLTIGIFIGAVWANVSWGHYWGWDPKEVWALITMLVYALALHPTSLPWFRRPMFFHAFCIAAFLTVLVTYFGVNFLLGGMHSYANG